MSAGSNKNNNNVHVPSGFRLHRVGDCNYVVPSRYSDLQPLGHGAQGAVVDALDSVTGERVAIKKLSTPFQNDTHAKRAYREFSLMKSCRHKNVISLLNAFTPQDSLATFSDVYLVQDKMDTTLNNVINISLDHERLSYLLYQLLCGLKHLHKSGIIHRDLKPTNVAVKQDCTLKILDFGLARVVQDTYMMTPYVVTRYYRAPEVILGCGYHENLDVWAVGCIFAEMVLKNIIFPGTDHVDQWNRITKILGTPSDEFIGTLDQPVQDYIRKLPYIKPKSFRELFPDESFQPPSESHQSLNAEKARDLLSRMLVINPRDRITVDEALVHPYIHVWYDESEVNGPPALEFDRDFDERNLHVSVWKEKLYREIVQFGSSPIRGTGGGGEMQ